MKHRKITLWAFNYLSAPWIRHRLLCNMIRFVTRSSWVHVGVSIDSDYIEAEMNHGVIRQNFVPKDAIEVKSWIVDDNKEADLWIDEQVGKPYDWLGVCGFIIGPSKDGRRDRGHWFCSELASAVIRQYGGHTIKFCDSKPAWEISPAELVGDFPK